MCSMYSVYEGYANFVFTSKMARIQRRLVGGIPPEPPPPQFYAISISLNDRTFVSKDDVVRLSVCFCRDNIYIFTLVISFSSLVYSCYLGRPLLSLSFSSSLFLSFSISIYLYIFCISPYIYRFSFNSLVYLLMVRNLKI